ncbi:hypothetical protein SDJN02_06691, partial [Cucurbita argyrosperma subsp. argyrosperma]
MRLQGSKPLKREKLSSKRFSSGLAMAMASKELMIWLLNWSFYYDETGDDGRTKVWNSSRLNPAMPMTTCTGAV